MKAMQIDWNPEKDITAVLQTPEYHALNDVAKLDILGDTIFTLHGDYLKLLGDLQDAYGKGPSND